MNSSTGNRKLGRFSKNYPFAWILNSHHRPKLKYFPFKQYDVTQINTQVSHQSQKYQVLTVREVSNLIIKLIFLHKVDKTKANLVRVCMHTHAQLCMQERKTDREGAGWGRGKRAMLVVGVGSPPLLLQL